MTSSRAPSDAIVIGGGHNGLVAAAVLAKSGRKVLVLESASEPGGAARTHEFAPGFHASLAHLLNRLHPQVIAALDLHLFGLDLATARAAPSVALGNEAPPLVLTGAYGEGLQGGSADLERAWRTLRAQLVRYAGVLKPLLVQRPPDLDGLTLSQATGLGWVALGLRRLGKEDMRDFLRLLLMNVADVIDEHLDDDRLGGLLAFDATLGSHLGPRSPTSLLGLYYRLAGEIAGAAGAQVVPVGGMGTVSATIARAARASGVTVRTDARVAKILIDKGRATGVALSGGEELRADVVISALNPRTTFLELVGTRELDTGFVRKVTNIRLKGNVAKLHLALDRQPVFRGVDADGHRGRLVIAPSVDHVERAFNPAKYGGFSADPAMEIVLPSLTDPSMAPAGACVLSACIQYAPYDLKEGWEAGRPKLLATAMAVLERHAPGIGASVLHTEVLAPPDIERRYAMPGGHWHHGEMQADQLLVSRPVSGAAGYATPIDGLYLAGAGSHPGGGVSGVPGLNAARLIVSRGARA